MKLYTNEFLYCTCTYVFYEKEYNVHVNTRTCTGKDDFQNIISQKLTDSGPKHLAKQLNTNKLHGLSHSKIRPKVTQFASNDPNLLRTVPFFTAKIPRNFYASENKVIILS